ncbi:MAG: c-type cytochrome [Halieaceae bacterium]|jgi:DMSO reductase family type II enzyme heme b subunit|nr:c-type cytochrome [Halieaceae bacterium]
MTLLLGVGFAGSSVAAPGDTENGEQIYYKRCLACHGEDGDGLGPAAERLNPPPRDFSSGQYKIMSTAFDEMVPQDDDIFRMIAEGMPGTAMPGWSDILSQQEMWDLVAYIKVFAGYDEEEPGPLVDYGTQVASSPESIARGDELFHESDRCSECHGESGKGDAIKGLKDDNGERTWPRNLTKPWTFRGSNSPKDIYARVSAGIPGTQMPSFADPDSTKVLTIEDRWHVANYVESLAAGTERVNPDNTVIKAGRAEGGIPTSWDDPAWGSAPASTFMLVPQIIAKQRHFTPSNDTVTVRAVYDDEQIAILVEWDDRTRSIPGDEKAEKISNPDISEDSVAIQLPIEIPEGMEKPYFGMGDASHPVNIWQWKSGTAETSSSVHLMNGQGFEDIEQREADSIQVAATGAYNNGTWRVVFTRPLVTTETDKDIQFQEGVFIPIAFAAWDGSASEAGSQHTMTTWYWLSLQSSSGSRPFFIALLAALLVAGLLYFWVRSARPQ